jgi:hypothetical protein
MTVRKRSHEDHEIVFELRGGLVVDANQHLSYAFAPERTSCGWHRGGGLSFE